MLTIVFEHDNAEEALKTRDKLCNALVGIPGFIENDIIVNTQECDVKGNALNEEGDLIVKDNDGIDHKHCVRLIMHNDKQPDRSTDEVYYVRKE